jgi:hypothetical protein
MAPKDLEKVIYFAAYMVISVDDEARQRDLATQENNIRLELKTLRRPARLAHRHAPRQKLEEELAALEEEAPRPTRRRRSRMPPRRTWRASASPSTTRSSVSRRCGRTSAPSRSAP